MFAKVKITLYMKGNAGYRRLIVDSEENFCGFLNGTSKSFLMSMMWPFVRTHGNLDHKCPFMVSEVFNTFKSEAS